MSSSMFIERTPLPATEDVPDYNSNSDSNLVVVYGKNGISFDDKGLESLIDEKKISSISVIRLTSPTPSMQEEEEEEARQEEIARHQDLDSANDSSDQAEESNISDGDRNITGDSDSSDREDAIQSSDEHKSKSKPVARRRGRQPNIVKQKKVLRKRKRDRPKIVGLRFEEFYSPDDAGEIVKEALKLAGLGPDRKSKEDVEFQLLVIKNDHCYTPFTSPSQMKAKLAADKLELEQQSNSRKCAMNPNQSSVGKQLFIRRKPIPKTDVSVKLSSPTSSLKEKYDTSLGKSIVKENKDAKSSENIEEGHLRNSRLTTDEKDYGSVAEEEDSECTAPEESDESDNDRDSDLDFDVNNPKGRRRKIRAAKIAKRIIANPKTMLKSRRAPAQEDLPEPASKPAVGTLSTATQKQRSNIKSPADISRITVRSNPTKLASPGACMFTKNVSNDALTSVSLASEPSTRKQNESKTLHTQITNIKTVPIKTSSAIKSLPSPQTHKEILIHKNIMSSPKTKGFTDLNTLLLEQQDLRLTPTSTAKFSHVKPSFKTSNASSVSPKPATNPKGFMQLGVEAASKNQLPAQISVQTHQSSSELEAEHDKQLDLINSIVQDEMRKSKEILTPAPCNIIENIPELVKMLESTEASLAPNITVINKDGRGLGSGDCESRSQCDKLENQRLNNQSETGNIKLSDIDLSHTSLLAGSDGNDDDLPDDILQQVVELIKDDKTLQEAVDVLGSGDSNDPITAASTMSNPNPPPLAPISQQGSSNKNLLDDIPHSSRSIIQMSISNITTTTSTATQSSPEQSRAAQQAIKISPLARKEPIQIVRGNGRVITLPPIEAPTTRAKRRAQAQPVTLPITVNSSTPTSVSVTIPNSSSDGKLDSCSIATTTSVAPINTPIDKRIQETSTRRRCSKENITATTTPQKIKRNVSRKSNKPKVDMGASDSGDEDDDDPNKLWCICRQPHNNRFMICCDVCEDWFHGTCVNITKAMGLEMEQKGIDWTCPKCVKKIEEQKQPKITDLFKKENSVSVQPAAVTNTSAVDTTSIINAASSSVATVVTNKLQQESNRITFDPAKSAVESPKTSLQSGQIINLKDFSGKKLFIQTTPGSTSGQKKIIVTTTQPLKTTSNLSSPVRTFAVVKQISCAGKQQSQTQNIKVIKTISPAQSTGQSIKVLTAPTKTISSNESLSPKTMSNELPTFCIVCKKNARSNSIYCSDDCIRKHSQTAWAALSASSQDDKTKKKSKGLFEEELSMPDRKIKMERVNVFERKSGRTLTGHNAPTFANLKKWLQENPTFEVVQPGSPQALDIEKRQKIRAQHSSSPTVPKMATSPPPLKLLPFSNTPHQQKVDPRSNSPQTHSPVNVNKPILPTLHTKPTKNIQEVLKHSPSTSSNSRPGTPKQLQKYPQHVSIKGDRVQKSNDDSKTPKDKQANPNKKSANVEAGNKVTGNDEDIRHVVRRTLREQLLQRIQEEGVVSTQDFVGENDTTKISDMPKLSVEEVEEFIKATELEMYNYFNRDTGAKYKAKYRSLMFNIKDRKNHTLYAKICKKLIEPKQLVRMSPDEMASQELAQWREQETKHQLEMIKKSELDLLSCAMNYVVKTHKGEEVIEGKSSEFETVGLTIPEEDDTASGRNKTKSSEEAAVSKTQSHTSEIDYLPASKSHSQYAKLSDDDRLKAHISTASKEKERGREGDREKDKDRYREKSRDKERDREKRHKSKDRYRDKSRTRKRSRSRSRSRSCDRSEKRYKSSKDVKDEKREKDKDKIKERAERDQAADKKSVITEKRATGTIKKKIQEQTHNTLEEYNLVDKILESTKTVEEAANLVTERNKETDISKKTATALLSAPPIISSSSDNSYVIDIPAPSNYVDSSDQEPSSTVSIPTPPHDPYTRFTSSSPSGDSSRYNHTILWSGNINMVDVTSFHLCLQPLSGTCNNISKLLAKELDVVGRIGPETVWDYISKIKKSPNKEIVLLKLLPASETETSAYKLLYEYLEIRNRLGVIKSVSQYIKDFYIYPLAAGKLMPSVLRCSESVEFQDDPYRPDILIGIIVRVVGKRYSSIAMPINETSSKFVGRDIDVHTPPGSPKLKKRRPSPNPQDIDIDAIIKAPIASKLQKAAPSTTLVSSLKADADEPYSPGGSSGDEDLELLPLKLPAASNQMQTAEEELKRKMEEINRQIAAQEMEIAGLLTGETAKYGKTSGPKSKVLANIAIPSNLPQILASIKTSNPTQEVRPAVPPPPPLIGSLITSTLPEPVDEYNPADPIESSYGHKSTSSTSRLAKLSEAELLSMVPDDIVINVKPPAGRCDEPPPPGV
ncbi:uncharacterized protein LOC101895968 [Musca domestica]|uniref:Uncharacterized protein LOC101895968 n=1 Tax=Musca domestica TaxID=7370 RepID=A0A9J7D800_MUSDO|nr:uncharacterized protein LOC101895968 [Musca domestica]XP_005188357.2 uncharacterized protein LOC101895968 [Musca domestica]XP_011294492.2 uncharacterized protein LOC101895968 [Musca domestica]